MGPGIYRLDGLPLRAHRCLHAHAISRSSKHSPGLRPTWDGGSSLVYQQLVNESGITHGDSTQVGYYVGIIVSTRKMVSELTLTREVRNPHSS